MLDLNEWRPVPDPIRPASTTLSGMRAHDGALSRGATISVQAQQDSRTGVWRNSRTESKTMPSSHSRPAARTSAEPGETLVQGTAPQGVDGLSQMSVLNTERSFLTHLRDRGRAAAEAWLSDGFASTGGELRRGAL